MATTSFSLSPSFDSSDSDASDVAKKKDDSARRPPAPPRQLFTCSWSECYVAGKLHGCQFPGLQPQDKCPFIGCDSGPFHHGCQTGWEMAQYLHDFPAGDPSQCCYEAGINGSKHCMKHHSFGNLAAAATGQRKQVSDATMEAAKTKGKETKAEQKQKLHSFVEKQTLDNIVLTRDKKDVASLAGVPWHNLTVDMKKSFMRDNCVAIPHSMRTNNDLGKVVANHLHGSDITIAVASTAAKKKNDATIPTCITQIVGTMIRVINAIVGCQAAYKATKGTNDREDQDTHRPKIAAWEQLSLYYNSDEEKLGEISPSVSHKMVGMDIPNDAGCEYDSLNADEMKEVVNYLNAQYRSARNSKSHVSGCHGGLEAHVKGKKWLLYYDYIMKEEGNENLSTFAFPVLPYGVVCTSTDDGTTTHKKRRFRKNSSSASERSYSTPGSGATATTAGEATVCAMAAVETRMVTLNDSEEFMQSQRKKAELARLKSEINRMNSKYNQLGSDYCDAKKDGKRSKLRELKVERNGLKSEKRMAEKNYSELKISLGYESPECSSASSPSEDED